MNQAVLQNDGLVMQWLLDIVHVYLYMLSPLLGNSKQKRIVDKVLPRSNSEQMPCNQTSWMQAFTAPRYSTSAEDNAMAACFFLDQQMVPPQKMNTYLEVYF